MLPDWLVSNAWVKQQLESQRLNQIEETSQLKAASARNSISGLNAAAAKLADAKAAEASFRATHDGHDHVFSGLSSRIRCSCSLIV